MSSNTFASTSGNSNLEEDRRKRLIVCCDGTWNSTEGNSLTNVARITRCISDVDDWNNRHISQIVHYQPGIGMGTGTFSNTYDAVVGRGISKSIREAYSFICLNWSNSLDEIILIGFSRGAFTVRCVADLINRIGLLTKSGLRHFNRLYNTWRALNDENDTCLKTLERDCAVLEAWQELRPIIKINACAVWDTVSATGRRYRIVGNKVPSNVELAIQALALDEKRVKFTPMVWESLTKSQAASQTLVQRWFSGNHSDVGGGNSDMTLANVTLAWMIGQLTDHVHFDHDNLWAITTTRWWSKPTPNDDNVKVDGDFETSDSPNMGHKRDCRVTASSPLSSALLRSEESWLSYLTKVIGGSTIRLLGSSETHYSVQIFDYLGIANYKTYFPQTISEKSRILRSEGFLEEFELKTNKFERDILGKWAEHILCAHIKVRQARNFNETLDMKGEVYKERISAELVQGAGYQALIPLAAVLSAFHSLAQKYHDKDSSPLERFCAQVEAQHKLSRCKRSKTTPMFKFELLSDPEDHLVTDSTTGSLISDRQELELVASIEGPVLVFTRSFNLLMGRCHELPGEDLTQSSTDCINRPPSVKLAYNQPLPCEKCDQIWPNPFRARRDITSLKRNQLG